MGVECDICGPTLAMAHKSPLMALASVMYRLPTHAILGQNQQAERRQKYLKIVFVILYVDPAKLLASVQIFDILLLPNDLHKSIMTTYA